MNKKIYKFKKKLIYIFLTINKIKHKYYILNSKYSTEEEIRAIGYMKKNGINTFTNELSKTYNINNITVYQDKKSDLKYVNWNGKRLYLPFKYCEEQIKDYIAFLYSEQDVQSPHSYVSVKVPTESVIIDIGAAEGNFTLDFIENISKAYIFESDKKWIQALTSTFEPYGDKVKIINTFVSRKNKIENYIEKGDFKKNIIIKIDAEGAEQDILETSEIIKTGNPSLVVATYHKGKDAQKYKNILVKYGYKVEFSRGLMLFLYSIRTSRPILRNGLIYASKRESINGDVYK